MYKVIDDYIKRLLDDSTPDRPIWNVEAYNHKEPKWNYIDACMCTSLLSFYRQTREQKYLDFVDNFMDYYVYEDGTIRGYTVDEYNIDHLSGGRVLIELYKLTSKPKYKAAFELLHTQLETHPRTKSGNFWHKMIYPNQIWLDGLFMAQVFYTLYETEFNKKENYPDILSQFNNVRKLMFNEQRKLYHHGYESSKTVFWATETGCSPSFWLRSTGWFVVALIDVIEIMGDCDSLKQIFIEAIEGLLNYLDKDQKMFYQVIDQPKKEGNYLETSGSAMIAYALLKGARLSVLPKQYSEVGKGIFEGICQKYLSVADDGKMNLGGICLVAGLGPKNNLRRNGTFEYYISEPVVQNDAKGVAPLIMAYSELRQMNNA